MSELDKRITTLENDMRVANFSSPHSFKFTDGNELPPVDDETANDLMLTAHETRHTDRKRARVKTISLFFELPENVKDEIDYWYTLWAMKKVDIVIVPLPVMQCLREIWTEKTIITSPFRVVRMADRINHIIHSDTFCI